MVATQSSAQPSATIPPNIKTYLDKRYPGWSVAKVDQHDIQTCFAKQSQVSPVVSGDFNGDGKPDYILEITREHKTMLLAFLSDGPIYVLASWPYARGYVLQVVRKGEKYFVVGDQKDRTFSADIVRIVFCKKGEDAYLFSRGSFHKIENTE